MRAYLITENVELKRQLEKLKAELEEKERDVEMLRLTVIGLEAKFNAAREALISEHRDLADISDQRCHKNAETCVDDFIKSNLSERIAKCREAKI